MNVRIQSALNGTRKKAFGEQIVEKREEIKAGAATVWKQKIWRSRGFLEMSTEIITLSVNLALKQSESGKKVKRRSVKARSIFSKSTFVKSALIYKIIKSIKSKQKKISKSFWPTVKLLMIQIKQLLTHSSSQKVLI